MKTTRTQKISRYIAEVDQLIDHKEIYESRDKFFPAYGISIECTDRNYWWRPFNVLLCDTPEEQEVDLHVCYVTHAGEAESWEKEAMKYHFVSLVKFLREQLGLSDIEAYTVSGKYARLRIRYKEAEDAGELLCAVILAARNFFTREHTQESLMPPVREGRAPVLI